MSISVNRIIVSGNIVFMDATPWFSIVDVFPGLFNDAVAVSYRMSAWAGVWCVSKLLLVSCFDALHGFLNWEHSQKT